MPCRAAVIGNESFGKIPRDLVPDQIFMEYSVFYAHLANYLPEPLNSRTDFKNFLKKEGFNLSS